MPHPTPVPAKTPKRIYVVYEDGNAKALVRATSQSRALKHYVTSRFDIEAVPADAEHVASLRTLNVEDAVESPKPAAS